MSVPTPESPLVEKSSSSPLEAQETLPPLTRAQVIWYSIANLGCGAFFSFNNYILPLFLKHYTNNAVILGLMGSSHSVEGAIIQPLVGSASDKLRSPWGRRRPFMVLFLLLSAVLMLLTPWGAFLPAGIRLGVIIGAIFLFTVFFNMGFDPYQALMPDITPEPQRGRVTGTWALFGNFAQAAILPVALILGKQFPKQPHTVFTIQFTIVGVLMIVTTLITCLAIRESRKGAVDTHKKSSFQEIKTAIGGLKTLKQAAMAMAVFAIAGAGVGAVVPNLSLFVQKVTHCDDGQAQMMGFVLMIATVVGVLPFGWLADRIGPKRVVFIGFSLIALASFCALFINTLGQVTLVMVIAGLGNAGQAASSYPLLTELVPGEEVGFFTGFQSTMLSLVQPLTVVITGMMINQGGSGYRIIFLVNAVCMLAAMGVLTRVHPQAAPPEIAARNREQGRGG